MAIMLVISIALVVWHFVYDGILAPAFRQQLRNELFCLRDQLRNLRIKSEIETRELEGFEFVHTGINVFITSLSDLNLTAPFELNREMRRDEHLKKKIFDRLELVNSCPNSEVQKIFKDTVTVVVRGFLINMGAWLIYVAPVLVVLICFKKIKDLMSELIVAPAHVSARFVVHRPVAS